MIIRTSTQPENQLGNEISELLNSEAGYSRIVFVSAFVALRTILRLRERLLAHVANGTGLHITVGIDLGGTSREVLEELLRWSCETFVFHNTIGRATFHPKIYLFQKETSATLFIGSNNLTDGGFYTNYEAATRYDFVLPVDKVKYERLIKPLKPFLEPAGPTVQRLNVDLINTLIARGELPTETEARQRRHEQVVGSDRGSEGIPASPFAPAPVPRAPLLPQSIRPEERTKLQTPQSKKKKPLPTAVPRPSGVLVWQKKLPQTDALQVKAGSHHVGGVRLTQARFENPPGQRIDQTTYFRRLFADYDWEPEPDRHRDQEHTFVPIRIIIRGNDYGIHNFEISHKPSGEAGQDNYTTILRWGREFNPIVVKEKLTDAIFSLYETPDENADFLIDITDS